MKKLIALFLFFAIGGLLPALAGGFQTVLVDAEKQPVPEAVVSFYTLPDSALVDAVTSDAEGHVAFANATAMALRVQALGFLSFVSVTGEVGDTLRLDRPTNQLRELVVNAKPVMQRTAGQFTYLPNDLRSKTDNSYELLRLVPLLDVSDRGISIFGKGASRIFINGRDPMIGLDATMEMLRATPPSHIVRIEIITAPGSKYSAADRRGIVNVVLSNPYEGIRGSTTATVRYTTGRVAPAYSLWLGASKGKFNASASFSYYSSNTLFKTLGNYNYTDLNRHVTNLSRTSEYYFYLSGAITATYDFTRKSFLSLGFRINDGKSYNKTRVITETTENGAPAVPSTSDIHSRSPFAGPNYGFVGYYSLKTDNKGSKLEIAADYFTSRTRNNTDYLFDATAAYQSESQASDGIHFRSDYNHVFNSSHKLDAGYDFFRSKLDDDMDFYAESNRFIYREMVNSVYASWRAQWCDAFSTSAGLRMENTDSDGHLIDTGERTKRNYTDLFPSISMSLNLPRGNQSISLDLKRGIFRPWYHILNPFMRWTSDNTYSKGNPYLKPSYDWFGMLYYRFLRNFTFYIQHIRSDNGFLEYNYNDHDGNTVSSTDDGGRYRYWEFRLQYNKTFWGKYNIRAETAASNTLHEGVIEGDFVRFSKTSWSIGVRNTFMLPKHGFQIRLSYSLHTPGGLFTRKRDRWNQSMYIEASKRLKKDLRISLVASNILDTKIPEFYDSPQYTYNLRRLTSYRSVTLRISYSFGKQKVYGAEDAENAKLEERISK